MKAFFSTLYLLVFTYSGLMASDLRIQANDLSKNINDYKIIDVRSSQAYTQGHIDGALNFPINLSYENMQLNGKLVNPLKMQEFIRYLGLNVNSRVIVYDDGTFFDASRLFWALEVYGFSNVKLLNTGYETWKASGYKTSKEYPSIKKSKYIAKVNNKRLATKFTTQIAVKNPNQIIVDARMTGAYEGKVSSARRYGHISQAISIPATRNIDTNTKVASIRSIPELKSLYASIDQDKKVIIYCAIGRIASTGYFALRELGYDVSNYDSSWREWGNDTELPIINPGQK